MRRMGKLTLSQKSIQADLASIEEDQSARGYIPSAKNNVHLFTQGGVFCWSGRHRQHQGTRAALLKPLGRVQPKMQTEGKGIAVSGFIVKKSTWDTGTIHGHGHKPQNAQQVDSPSPFKEALALGLACTGKSRGMFSNRRRLGVSLLPTLWDRVPSIAA